MQSPFRSVQSFGVQAALTTKFVLFGPFPSGSFLRSCKFEINGTGSVLGFSAVAYGCTWFDGYRPAESEAGFLTGQHFVGGDQVLDGLPVVTVSGSMSIIPHIVPLQHPVDQPGSFLGMFVNITGGATLQTTFSVDSYLAHRRPWSSAFLSGLFGV